MNRLLENDSAEKILTDFYKKYKTSPFILNVEQIIEVSKIGWSKKDQYIPYEESQINDPKLSPYSYIESSGFRERFLQNGRELRKEGFFRPDFVYGNYNS